MGSGRYIITEPPPGPMPSKTANLHITVNKRFPMQNFGLYLSKRPKIVSSDKYFDRKRSRDDIGHFIAIRSKFENFVLWNHYTPQMKAENKCNLYSGRKSMISSKE